MKKTATIFFCVIAFAIKDSNAQIITTVAGNGAYAYSGDNGPATAASLYEPFGVTVDASGNIYIPDNDNNAIRKVNTAGVITTIAGGNALGAYAGDGGPATAASLANPSEIWLDGNGNIYIADDANFCIRKINSAGIISTVAGTGVQGYTGDGGPATNATFMQPNGIVFDGSGNLYISDYRANVVRMVNTSGIISTIAGNGTAGYSGDGGPATDAEFNFPYSLGIDRDNNIYVTDQVNNAIRKINTSGIISTIAGGTYGYSGDGGPATAAELNNPLGVTVDTSGNIYIADFYNNVIRKVNSSGIITTIAGNNTAGYTGDGGPATAAEFYNPGGVCLDGSGNIFIADTYNSVIRKINHSTTGINIISNNNGLATEVAPNPSTSYVLLNYAGASDNVNIKLTDVTGRIVYSTKCTGQSGKVLISLAPFPAGYYLLVTESGNARAINKVVKE